MSAETEIILNTLQQGEIQLQGQFLNGSNYTFMVEVRHEEQVMSAVYKPVRGEQPLWDFPQGTLSKREVAAYQFSQLLGWNLVPLTVYRRKGPLGAGSLQQFIECDAEYHYFNFNEEDRARLRPVALFDVLINNADRKGGHILKGSTDGHLWLIDHGICFHVEDKLRTVVWDFAGEPIPEDLFYDLCSLIEKEEQEQQLTHCLENLLRSAEIRTLLARARHLVDQGVFPSPMGSRRSYPWPPV